MATGKIKVNFKMPTPSAADRMYAKHQAIRKAAGLPDVDNNPDRPDAGKYSSGQSKPVKRVTPIATPSVNEEDITVVKKGSNIKKKISDVSYNVFKKSGYVKEAVAGVFNTRRKSYGPPTDHSVEKDTLENIPSNDKSEKGKRIKAALDNLGNSMKEKYPKLREAKDSQEYDYEGDMAKSDLRSIIHNAQTLHDMLDDDTNLAEWCQSKITLAEDYISTVTNYMRSEMKEEVELDEAKKMEYDQKKVNHLKYIVDILEKEKKEFSRLKDSKEVMDAINKAINIFAKEYTKHLNALSAGRGQDTNFRVIEEVEQIDEISAQLKASYVAGAKKQIKQSIPYTKKGEEYRDIAKNFIAKRERGIAKVTESAADDPKADQMTTDDTKFPKKSRKAQIVKAAAKKIPPEDQFQAKPVLDSQVAQQTNK